MKRTVVLRFSQLSLVIICFLHELINFFTNMGHFSLLVERMLVIMRHPTPSSASTLIDRSIDSVFVAKLAVTLITVIHLLVALVLLWGLLRLVRDITTTDFRRYNKKKYICILGLVLGLCQYFFLFLVIAMGYFLSWMQEINFNADITTFALLFATSLFYLLLVDFREM